MRLSMHSKRYSVTWRVSAVAERLADGMPFLVVGTLTFAGMGWHTPADQLLATSAAARAREYRRALKQEREAA